MTPIDEIMAQANRYALRNAQYCGAHVTNPDLVSGEVAALRAIITQAITKARAEGAREMREFAAQESRWGGDSGCDADAMTAYIRAMPLPDKREVVRLTDEAVADACRDIAIAVAKNCGSVPQLTHPHIYLGVRKLLAANGLTK